MTQPPPGNVPDLGNIGKPKRVAVAPAMLVRGESPDPNLVTATELLTMIHSMIAVHTHPVDSCGFCIDEGRIPPEEACLLSKP